MATSYVRRVEWITTLDEGAAYGAPFKVDGSIFDIQILIGNEFTIRVSLDGTNWIIGTDADGNALSGLVTGDYRIAREAPYWVRAEVEAPVIPFLGGGGGQDAIWWIGVQKSI